MKKGASGMQIAPYALAACLAPQVLAPEPAVNGGTAQEIAEAGNIDADDQADHAGLHVPVHDERESQRDEQDEKGRQAKPQPPGDKIHHP